MIASISVREIRHVQAPEVGSTITGTSMPRYFFHLVKGSEVIAHDATGHECTNDHVAVKFARQGDGLVVLKTPPPSPLKQYHIQVLNEAGQSIVTVPLSEIRAA
jgi:hypothetical protein